MGKSGTGARFCPNRGASVWPVPVPPLSPVRASQANTRMRGGGGLRKQPRLQEVLCRVTFAGHLFGPASAHTVVPPVTQPDSLAGSSAPTSAGRLICIRVVEESKEGGREVRPSRFSDLRSRDSTRLLSKKTRDFSSLIP